MSAVHIPFYTYLFIYQECYVFFGTQWGRFTKTGAESGAGLHSNQSASRFYCQCLIEQTEVRS